MVLLQFQVFSLLVLSAIGGKTLERTRRSFSFLPTFLGGGSNDESVTSTPFTSQQYTQNTLPVYRIQSYNGIDYPRIPINVLPLRPSAGAGNTASAVDPLPYELAEIANRIGIRETEQIPSLDEIGKVIGSETPEETVNTLRELAATEDGIELMRSYIQGERNRRQQHQKRSLPIFSAIRGSSLGSIADRTHTNLDLAQPAIPTAKPGSGVIDQLLPWVNFLTQPDNTQQIYSPLSQEQQTLTHNIAPAGLIPSRPIYYQSSVVPSSIGASAAATQQYFGNPAVQTIYLRNPRPSYYQQTSNIYTQPITQQHLEVPYSNSQNSQGWSSTGGIYTQQHQHQPERTHIEYYDGQASEKHTQKILPASKGFLVNETHPDSSHVDRNPNPIDRRSDGSHLKSNVQQQLQPQRASGIGDQSYATGKVHTVDTSVLDQALRIVANREQSENSRIIETISTLTNAHLNSKETGKSEITAGEKLHKVV